MAKLTRYLQKIFANNSNEVGVFGTGVDKETSKNVETLQSADYEEGWSSAIITNKNYPIWQEMDGVQYGLSYQLKYLFQNGIPEWISTETYYTNSYCRVGSNVYYSLQDDNINHNPALNDGWWTPLLTSNRSIGEIITSCVPLTDAGLHLLDGSLIQGNGIYSNFVSYMGDLYNTTAKTYKPSAFTVVGSPNITDDGIVSGFSSSNYLKTPVIDFSKSWEIQQECTVTDLSKTNGIFEIDGDLSAGNYCFMFSDRFSFRPKINDTIETNLKITGTFTTGTYKFIIGWDKTKYYIKIKAPNASTWQEKSIDNVNPIDVSSTTRMCYLGWTPINTTWALNGSIDLKQFSITVDGTQVFSGSDRTGFCLESEWQQSVSTYGVCGKFVYEPSSNTVRLPKVTGIIEGTTDVSALGDLVEAGLPDHDHTFVLTENETGTGYATQGSNYAQTQTTSLASESNSIYGNSTTVQPQTIKVLYYIVVATSVKTNIEVDIDEIVTDLNGKLDKDGSNAPNKISDALLSKWIPDYANGISLSATSFPYTLPSAGYIFVDWYVSNYGALELLIDNNPVDIMRNAYNGDLNMTVRAFANKGNVVSFTGNDKSFSRAIFYPLKGAN